MNRLLCATLIIATSIISSLHAAADDDHSCVRFQSGNTDEKSLAIFDSGSSFHLAIINSPVRTIIPATSLESFNTLKSAGDMEVRLQGILDPKDSMPRTESNELFVNAFSKETRYLIITPDSVKARSEHQASNIDAFFDTTRTGRLSGRTFAVIDMHTYLQSLFPGLSALTVTASTAIEGEPISRETKIAIAGGATALLVAGVAIAYKSETCSIQ